MNILKHKSWHTLRKENIARVRRDEAKAAAEEQAKLDRVKLAENEDRINRLRRKATEGKSEDVYTTKPSSSREHALEGHVNFFADLEAQDRKNLASGGNKEYQAEKKDEHNKWESKMGIMKKFAEDTHELTGESSWWQKIEREEPKVVEKPKVVKKKKSDKELRREVKKQLKAEKKRKKRRRHSSSSSDEDSSKAEAKRQKLEMLRKERLERERAEQRRVLQLVEGSKPKEKAITHERPKRPSYSNQFNPDLVRRH